MMTGAALGLGSLFGARFLLGLGEAGAFPVASRGMQLWFPRSERGRIQGTTHFFSRFAVADHPVCCRQHHARLRLASNLLYFWIARRDLVGGFSALYRNRPEDHERVNPAELAQIRGLNPDGRSRRSTCAAIGALETNPQLANMWFIALGYCCFFFGTNFYLTWYPTYLREHRHHHLQALGLHRFLSAVRGDGWRSGWRIAVRSCLQKDRERAARAAVLWQRPDFFFRPYSSIPAATTASASTSVMCLAASFFFLEFVIGPAWAVPMDVGGQFSGTVTGIMNMAGAVAASFTPLVFGYYFGIGSWSIPFFITSGVMLFGAAIWTFLIHPERSVVDATP